jgi:uncharacterized protein (TIGR02246 family)
MRSPSLLIIVTLTLTSASPHAQRARAEADDVTAETTIRQLEKDWDAALVRGDQTTIDRIMAEDCLLVSSTGELMTKGQADADRRTHTKISASTITQINVRVFGDTAIVIGTNLETSTYDGHSTSGQYRWTDVFMKRSGRWRVVSAQSTSMSP